MFKSVMCRSESLKSPPNHQGFWNLHLVHTIYTCKSLIKRNSTRLWFRWETVVLHILLYTDKTVLEIFGKIIHNLKWETCVNGHLYKAALSSH